MESRCTPALSVSPRPSVIYKSYLGQKLVENTINDPVIILITLAVVTGSFCLLAGLILLCVVSQTLQNECSEAILLIGIGFFITLLSCITWKLTSDRRLPHRMETNHIQTI